MIHRLRPSSALTIPLLLWWLLPAPSEAAMSSSVIRMLLNDAAARFDIPRAVLYGVSYNESRWHELDADSLSPSCSGMPPGYGIMGLHDDAFFGHSLRAGEPIGISAERARSSVEMNIIAGAYHLSTLFDGADRTDIAQWQHAAGRYSGLPETRPALQLLYVDGVFELLRSGWVSGAEYVAPTSVPRIDRAELEKGLMRMGLRASDYPSATWQPSPNYSTRGGSAVTAITIHDTEGNFAGSVAWLISTESQASAHYIIRSVDGFIVQMVSEAEKAWHVRTENPYTIGIEHEGFVARPEFFTERMYEASADLVRWLIDRYRIPLRRDRVKGHLDFPNNTHTDPGGWWNWPHYYRLIERAPNAPVVIDPFEDDVVGWWQPAMSGSTVKADTARSTFAIDPAGAHTGAGGAALGYAFTEASGGVVRFFRSGHGNTSDGLLNVGTSGLATLWVDGDGGGNALELWFYDTAKRNVILPAGEITWSGWRAVAVPVASLGTAGPYRFHSIVLRQRVGAARSGRIGVDDLAHEIAAASVPTQTRGAAVPRKLFVLSSGTLPRELYELGPATLYDDTGASSARYPALPTGAVGAWLRPGTYALRFDALTVMLCVAP